MIQYEEHPQTYLSFRVQRSGIEESLNECAIRRGDTLDSAAKLLRSVWQLLFADTVSAGGQRLAPIN